MLTDIVVALLAIYHGEFTIPLVVGAAPAQYKFWVTDSPDGQRYLNFLGHGFENVLH